MASPQLALRQFRKPHIDIIGERCPVCDQPIPNEKAEEVRARMEARDRELTEAADAQAAQRISQIETNARVATEQIRKEGAEAFRRYRAK